PERAAWSGRSARRVVVSRPVVTWQSSNCARSVLSAWPLKVISYVCGPTGITPRSRWLTLAASVRGGIGPRRHPIPGDPGLTGDSGARRAATEAGGAPRDTEGRGLGKRGLSASPDGRYQRGGVALAPTDGKIIRSPGAGFRSAPCRPARAVAYGGGRGRCRKRHPRLSLALEVPGSRPRSSAPPSSSRGSCAGQGCSTCWTGENKFALPWWWVRRGQARPCSWPTGWQLARNGRRRGWAATRPTPRRGRSSPPWAGPDAVAL